MNEGRGKGNKGDIKVLYREGEGVDIFDI